MVIKAISCVCRCVERFPFIPCDYDTKVRPDERKGADHLLDFNSFSTVPYRKITNKSPGLIEVRKHSLMDLYSGGLIFGGSFGLTGDLCMQKKSPCSIQSERLVINI